MSHYFYRHPFSDQGHEPYSYVRILPGEDRYPWQKEIVRKGPMFARIKLELHPWKRSRWIWRDFPVSSKREM
jgi:hypothetical protein